jgi:hypothetical protein
MDIIGLVDTTTALSPALVVAGMEFVEHICRRIVFLFLTHDKHLEKAHANGSTR